MPLLLQVYARIVSVFGLFFIRYIEIYVFYYQIYSKLQIHGKRGRETIEIGRRRAREERNIVFHIHVNSFEYSVPETN